MKTRLKELRKSKKMRQEDIAVQLGISRGQYASVERGKYDLTQKNMLMLASIYDVTLDYMMGRTDVREKMPIKLSAVEVELIKTLHEINQEKLTCSILEFLKNGILAQAKGTQSAEASTAERIGNKILGASPQAQVEVNNIIRQDNI